MHLSNFDILKIIRLFFFITLTITYVWPHFSRLHFRLLFFFLSISVGTLFRPVHLSFWAFQGIDMEASVRENFAEEAQGRNWGDLSFIFYCAMGPWASHIIALDVSFSLSFLYMKLCTRATWNKLIMTCIYYYGIIQSSFTAVKVLCALSIHPPQATPPHPWNHHHFTVFIVLSFPECHLCGIIQ